MFRNGSGVGGMVESSLRNLCVHFVISLLYFTLVDDVYELL